MFKKLLLILILPVFILAGCGESDTVIPTQDEEAQQFVEDEENNGIIVKEATDSLTYTRDGEDIFTYQSVHGYVGTDAENKLLEVLGFQPYGQEIEDGYTLYVVENDVTLLKDCVEDDFWEVFMPNHHRKAPSSSAGEVGKGYMMVWDKSIDLYQGTNLSVYKPYLLDPEYGEFYSELSDNFYIQHIVQNY